LLLQTDDTIGNQSEEVEARRVLTDDESCHGYDDHNSDTDNGRKILQFILLSGKIA